MATQKITLTLDEGTPYGAYITGGSAFVALSARTPDPADSMIVGQAPAEAQFTALAPPSVQLYPNDLLGNGTTTYTITYNGVRGNPRPWTFRLLSVNGTAQRLSAILAAAVLAPLAMLNADGGTAATGKLQAAVIDGGAAAGLPSAGMDGGIS